MDNKFITSLADRKLFFMGSMERAVGWSATDGWVCPSNDIVDLYTREQVMSGRIKPPTQPGDWQWIQSQWDYNGEVKCIDPKDIPNA